ncbi:MAG: phage tail protein [Caldilineaceae bacterium]
MSLILRQVAPEGGRLRISLRNEQPLVIGRHQSSSTQASTVDVELDSEQIASQHIRITVNEDESVCMITDLGSEYGTRVGNNRLEAWIETQLLVGQTLTLGFDYSFALEEIIRPAGSYGEITSVEEDRRLPATLPAAERYIPTAVASKQKLYWGEVPPGLTRSSLKLLHFLPEIYQLSNSESTYITQWNQPSSKALNAPLMQILNQELLDKNAGFLTRLLALIESVSLPIEWTVDNFDLFIGVHTAPTEYLSWLEQWFGILTDSSWSDVQRRMFIVEADWLFARRGTKKALIRILEIYTGAKPMIVEMADADASDEMAPWEFHIQLQGAAEASQVDLTVVKKIINTFKPAHTTFKLIEVKAHP